MNAADQKQLADVLGGVHDFYGKELSKFAVTVWLQACEMFDVEQVTKALSAHLMDAERGQFMPKPADIVRQLEGTRTDRSLIAWGKVLDAMQRVGAYQSVVFDDGAIHAAISDMGGWTAVCRSETNELSFTQRRFCDLHRAYSARPNAAYPARLVGDHEMHNAPRGYSVAPPMLIGDAQRAQTVERLGSAGPKTAITAADAVPAIKRLGRMA